MKKMSKAYSFGVESFPDALLDRLKMGKSPGCESWKVMGELGKGNSVEMGLSGFATIFMLLLTSKKTSKNLSLL